MEGAGLTAGIFGDLSGRGVCAMRVVWRGTISFGLVTIPVRLYVATENKKVPSHQIHVSDGGRVQYKRVCSIDGAEVPYEEIGRGYESATGELVVLSDVDLATLPAKTSRSIEIVSFLPVSYTHLTLPTTPYV